MQPMTQSSGSFRNVSPSEAQQLADDGVRLVDVRQPHEFDQGHMPGAELHPLNEWPALVSGWDRTQPVLVICRSGGRSSRAAAMLVDAGFDRVYNLDGGMMAYEGAGLPME